MVRNFYAWGNAFVVNTEPMVLFPPYQRRVQFVDTDQAGVVHFTTILRYVEEAEHAMMQDVVGVAPMSQSGGFPKVRVVCDYQAPIRFGEQVEVELKIDHIGKTSLQWAFSMFVEGRQVAQGEWVTVYLDAEGKKIEISEAMREKLVGSKNERSTQEES